MNILLSTPACLTRIAKCWQSQLLSIFLGITHLFSNQVCKSGIAYPLLVRHKAFYKGTPLTFMEMDISCRTQDTKQKKSPSWCVMLTLSRKGCKLNFYFGANFFIWTTKNEQNWLYAKDQKQKKNGNNAQFHYPSIQNIFLLPLWEPVLPLCAILRAKSR